MNWQKKFFGMTLAVAMFGAVSAAAAADIDVITREAGSGTRSAFIELFGIEQKNAEGKKVDMTTEDADITNSTAVMLTAVAGDPNSIGYISLGSMNDTVKALQIEGVDATAANIKNGLYKPARPFNITVKGTPNAETRAFLDFIMSAEGQAVVEKNGYIAVNPSAAKFVPSGVSGKVTVAGSSSVTPVMEKLKEAYEAIVPNAQIEIQQSDSTTGVNSTISDICNIGMASRELKGSELAAGARPTRIAIDGIAVIINKKNAQSTLTVEQVRDIYTGKTTAWEGLK